MKFNLFMKIWQNITMWKKFILIGVAKISDSFKKHSQKIKNYYDMNLNAKTFFLDFFEKKIKNVNEFTYNFSKDFGIMIRLDNQIHNQC